MIPSFEKRGTTFKELEELTLTALDAAEQGRWDLVAAYYDRRGEQLARTSLRPRETEQLLKTDREIRERIGVAQTALTSVIQESARVAQRLNGLRQRIGTTSSESGMILLEA